MSIYSYQKAKGCDYCSVSNGWEIVHECSSEAEAKLITELFNLFLNRNFQNDIESKNVNQHRKDKMLYNKKFYLNIQWWTGVITGILFNIAVFAIIAHFVHF